MAGGADSKIPGGTAGSSVDSPKRHGDKLGEAVGQPPAEEGRDDSGPAGDPRHDSPKRQGDKLEKSRDAAAGKS